MGKVIVIFIILALGAFYWWASSGAPESEVVEVIEEETTMEEPKGELGIEVVTEGEGDEIQNGQTAVVHYTGTLTDGTKFDSSVDRGVPFEFSLGAGMVIKGWDQGVLGMKVGEKRKLTIPAHLGYGDRGAPPAIPPGATLLFDVELVGIK